MQAGIEEEDGCLFWQVLLKKDWLPLSLSLSILRLCLDCLSTAARRWPTTSLASHRHQQFILPARTENVRLG